MKGDMLKGGSRFMWLLPTQGVDPVTNETPLQPEPTELTVSSVNPVYGSRNSISYYVECYEASNPDKFYAVVIEDGVEIDIKFTPDTAPEQPSQPFPFPPSPEKDNGT